MSLANTALIAHTRKLDLVIRHVLAGLGHGIHAGRERGAGVEFSEYRAYVPGDEWRRVDWKLAGRADRYFVREAERDSHVAVWLVLDASASMAEPSRSAPGLDKLAYARMLLGCVAAIAQRQGDAFGLVVLGGGKAAFTPALRGPRHLQRVLSQLQRAEPDGELPDTETLKASLHFAQSPSAIYAASDLLDWPSPLSVALTRLRQMRHDVRVLGLQTQAEVDASFSSELAYRDPERQEGVFRFGADLKEGYRRNREVHFGAVTAQCRKNDMPLTLAAIEQSPIEVLRRWLRRPGR
ncbi:hypothetical protein NM04_21735 [Massilia aurea]|uniref:DUF58 domain-containing protein n=1 Tax=Massilia aurea TaxID=373040 RepID=A0A422QFJ6_9BURK|nr:DUF58 domain-containing protein [Massilia aurea]RNF28715.1 hypothetical protein NM04_21735 [Massilia aurea]